MQTQSSDGARLMCAPMKDCGGAEGGVPLGQEQVRAHLVIHLISNERLCEPAENGTCQWENAGGPQKLSKCAMGTVKKN